LNSGRCRPAASFPNHGAGPSRSSCMTHRPTR
jgi:hypothetical protein